MKLFTLMMLGMFSFSPMMISNVQAETDYTQPQQQAPQQQPKLCNWH
ncbi:MAG: hypothetical protein ACD_73C00261G0002, partial [uncultured bacterium]